MLLANTLLAPTPILHVVWMKKVATCIHVLDKTPAYPLECFQLARYCTAGLILPSKATTVYNSLFKWVWSGVWSKRLYLLFQGETQEV